MHRLWIHYLDLRRRRRRRQGWGWMSLCRTRHCIIRSWRTVMRCKSQILFFTAATRNDTAHKIQSWWARMWLIQCFNEGSNDSNFDLFWSRDSNIDGCEDNKWANIWINPYRLSGLLNGWICKSYETDELFLVGGPKKKWNLIESRMIRSVQKSKKRLTCVRKFDFVLGLYFHERGYLDVLMLS